MPDPSQNASGPVIGGVNPTAGAIASLNEVPTDRAPRVLLPVRRTIVGRLGLALLGVALALPAAELLARLTSGGAQPALDIYAADPRYGVRLRPLAHTRLRSREGHLSELSTNSLGFRGPEWAAGGVLLLGDSQMMGYGVDEAETTAAYLGARLDRPVLSATIPSWGPIEYALAAEELIPRFAPTAVIYVANLANDWPEANVPNARRSDAEDGWLIRRRAQPAPQHDRLLPRSELWLAVQRARALLRGAPPELMLGAPAARKLLNELPTLGQAQGGDRSRLTPTLRRVLRACEDRGCRVVAALLPFDVQVDPLAWAKYREAPQDLSALEPLAQAFLEDAARLGVSAIHLGPPLAAASPGAFQPDDPHLSARGHRAVAAALGELIEHRQARLEDR